MSRPDDNTTKLTPADAPAITRAVASQPDPLPRGAVVDGEVQELEGEGGAELEGGGPRKYPGVESAEHGQEFFTSNCAHGCGCWMGASRSGGPDGVDPFGACPKAPASAPVNEELEVVAVRSRTGALVPTYEGFEEREGDIPLVTLATALGRIRELEERLAVWIDAGRKGAERIRELEGELESEREACTIATRKWTELESRLARLRPVVRAVARLLETGEYLEHRADDQGLPAVHERMAHTAAWGGVEETYDALLPEDRQWAEGSQVEPGPNLSDPLWPREDGKEGV